jgi:outer membrane murein-binding lipoprotein Lpp
MKNALLLSMAIVMVLASMILAGCASTPGVDELPAWATAIRADVIVLVADVRAGASVERLRADVDAIIADLKVIGPRADEIRLAAEVLLSDFREPVATREKKISDGLALLTAISKLRD